jgi:hypothetical protein
MLVGLESLLQRNNANGNFAPQRPGWGVIAGLLGAVQASARPDTLITLAKKTVVRRARAADTLVGHLSNPAMVAGLEGRRVILGSRSGESWRRQGLKGSRGSGVRNAACH